MAKTAGEIPAVFMRSAVRQVRREYAVIFACFYVQ